MHQVHIAAMVMNPQRRQLFKLGAAGLLLAPVSPLLASQSLVTELKTVAITDNLAQPLFGEGDWLVADTSGTGFSGEGLYLFPAWGQPRVYLVTQAPENTSKGPAVLEFRNPASGHLQWTQSLAGETLFAGRICGRLSGSRQIAGLELAPLSVPVLPQHS